MEPTNLSNVQRLLSAQIDEDSVIRIASSAAFIYNRNRREKGKQGPFGMTGCQVYDALAQTPDGDPDINAFAEFRSHTAEELSGRLMLSRATAGKVVNSLIQHGFIEKRRNGVHFAVRLAIPSVALTELGEEWTAEEEVSDTFGEMWLPLGKRLLELFPRSSTKTPG